jgi:hypothetical protein
VKKFDYRTSLSYGVWRCADGSEVLFDRRYQPMRRRHPDGHVTAADPAERIPFTEQVWFYNDATSPRVDKATKVRCLKRVVRGRRWKLCRPFGVAPSWRVWARC